MSTLTFVYAVVALAFLFDFINGFHDAANSVATIVATGILKPWMAVLWAAFFNFIAFLFFHLTVANTIGVGLVFPEIIDTYFIMAALVSAILFNLITWYWGMPSSSSHALIGGLIGAAVVTAGVNSLNYMGLSKIVGSILLSPLLGFLMAWLSMSGLLKKRVDPNLSSHHQVSRYVQLAASAMLSLGHGGNDAQKTMGIIAVLLYSAGLLGDHFTVPFWVIILCNLVMGLGTLVGGWRIINTLGRKITYLNPVSGSCSSISAALTLFTANYYGIPVSTTHIVTGAITGVGSAIGGRGSNWTVLRKIMWTWFFTIPCAALMSALIIGLKPLF